MAPDFTPRVLPRLTPAAVRYDALLIRDQKDPVR